MGPVTGPVGFSQENPVTWSFSFLPRLPLAGLHMGFPGGWTLVHVPVVSPDYPTRRQEKAPQVAKSQKAHIETRPEGPVTNKQRNRL